MFRRCVARFALCGAASAGAGHTEAEMRASRNDYDALSAEIASGAQSPNLRKSSISARTLDDRDMRPPEPAQSDSNLSPLAQAFPSGWSVWRRSPKELVGRFADTGVQEVDPSEEEIEIAVRTFEFGDYGEVYRWVGRAMAYGEELDDHPYLDVFFQSVEVKLPVTPTGLKMADFLTQTESFAGQNRNRSKLSESARPLDHVLYKRLNQRAAGVFCWHLARNEEGDQAHMEAFLNQTYVEWFHRADYLMGRYSREKSEYRKNLTLEQVMSNAQQRSRRVDRRKERDAKKKKWKEEKGEYEFQHHFDDVLPRALREQLEKQAMGVDQHSLMRENQTIADYMMQQDGVGSAATGEAPAMSPR